MASLRERLGLDRRAPQPPPCTCHVGANGWWGIVPPPPCPYHDPPKSK